MDWFKTFHGFSSDKKLGLIAHTTKIPRAIINGIFIDLLEYASINHDRGSIHGYDIETQALNLGIDEDMLSNALLALRNKLCVTGDKIANWDKYQRPIDRTNAERQERYRNKKKQEDAKEVTAVTKRNALCNTDKIREDKKVYTLQLKEIPQEWVDWCKNELSWKDVTISETWSAFSDYWTIGKGKGTKRTDWILSWKTWCRKQYDKPSFEKPKSAMKGTIV